MYFRIIAFILIFFCNKLVAQVRTKGRPSKNIVILTQTYLGFNVYELAPVERLEQIIKDSSNTIDTLITGTKTRRMYLRVSCTSFNPFTIPLDSVKLEVYEG